MNSVRDAVLLGTREATQTHVTLKLRERAETYGGAIDVFGTIEGMGISLLFRPLDRLLGSCVRFPGVGAGILVNSRRDLHLQRFTAAHELGHYVLQHEGSLDREIRMPGQTARRDLREVSADAFAAEFLMPKWLVVLHAKRHQWNTQKLSLPIHAYQLSLRLALSYDATCLGLLVNKILSQPVVDKLRKATPKQIKKQILGGATLDDPWADVWLIDEHDTGAAIEAGPNDVFVANLSEHSGAGYIWDVASLHSAGFTLLEDHGQADDRDTVGGPSKRRLVFKGAPAGSYQLSLSERRPWENVTSAIQSLDLAVSTFGPESAGLPRRSRPAAGSATVH